MYISRPTKSMIGHDMRILGIDPGAKGALGIIDTDKRQVAAYNIPIQRVDRSTKTATYLDANKLAARINLAGPFDEVWIEDVHSMPTDGHVGAFTFGMNKGALIATVELCGYQLDTKRLHLTHPSIWKKRLGLTRDKSKTKEFARKLFRDCKFATSNEGKCEALLIALYGVLQHEVPSYSFSDFTKQG